MTAPVDYQLTEDVALRERYEAALAPRRFAEPDRTHVVMGVYTTDLAEGRGDVYVAVGLGRQLERHGYEVVYLGREDWYDPPEGTDLFLSMLAERTVMLDPLRLPPSIRRVAWVRNNTDRWAASAHLAVYDAVLCSSELSERVIRRVYPGRIGILRIGVDHELFRLDGVAGGAGRLVTTEGAAVGADAPAAPGTDQEVAAGPNGHEREHGGLGGPAAAIAEHYGVVSTVNQWGGERGLFAALRRQWIDYPLVLYGQHRQLSRQLQPFAREPVSFFALPSLYRQAAVVLDDQQDVNRGYGNVNSRIYEALACGAYPITNTRLGLRQVGLDDLPAYTSAEDLHLYVHALLQTPERRALDVARLREVVLRDHTYAARARRLHEFFSEHQLAGPDARPASHRVVAFLPDYRATNPYQSMLYAGTGSVGVATMPVGDLDQVAQVSALLAERLILHVHWTAPVLGPANERDAATARLRAFHQALDGVAARGGRIVWTVHNVLPHECRFPDLEAELRQGLADRADAVHVMCAQTVEATAAHYRLPADRLRLIPHASYVDVYPNLLDRPTARAELGLPPDATVFLFLGQVRPYKGLGDLLDAFARLRAGRPDARLLVAGNPGRDPGSQALADRIRRAEGVVARLGVLADTDLQREFNAADVVVLPYRAALNSGALKLALSFGRPVVAAAVGCLPSTVSPEYGVTYDPHRDDLAAVLLQAAERLTGPAAQQAAYAAARAYTHLDMADDFGQLVAELASGERAPVAP